MRRLKKKPRGFAREIDLLLRQRHLKRTDLATLMGISRPRVTQLLSGRSNPTLKVLVKAADALGCKLDIQFINRESKVNGKMSNKLSRQTVYKEIDRARDYQDQKHGDHHHSPAEWIMLMESYIQEAKIAFKTGGELSESDILIAIREITACGVCCLEQNGAVIYTDKGEEISEQQCRTAYYKARDAYYEGREAYYAGTWISDNPYLGREEAEKWDLGWEDAKNHDRRTSIKD